MDNSEIHIQKFSLIYFTDTIPKNWRQNLCTESRTVFAAHPEDCSKFFICHAHRPFPVDCAAGTLYDKNLKICNHAYAVDCIKEPLKTSEKTDPCLKKGFGINPRDAMIGLDPKCEESLALTKKDLLKAVPTTTEIIKTTVIEKTTTSEKTDPSPCLKKEIGINPRDAIIDLDSNCEENLMVSKSENQPTPPLPPCKLDIRLGDPESDIIFDTEKCDPTFSVFGY